jgi:dCMP deaminase
MSNRKWDERFLRLAAEVATWSKDKSAGVGAIIIGYNNRILSTGYNGFPRGVNDDIEERHERPAKYFWTIHAEANAILNCDEPLRGSTLYLSSAPYVIPPCAGCAGMIKQKGIVRVVYRKPGTIPEQWITSCAIAETIFKEGGIVVERLD